jgi:carboxyl-terminal processing protease
MFSLLLVCVALVSAEHARAQGFGNFGREHGRAVLKSLKGDLEKNYYDESIRGEILDSRFKQAEEKINAATSTGQVLGVIAQALVDLNDSHTFFLPPQRVSRTQYGWQMQMIGDDCFVVAVKPGSNAEAKGLRPGDKILSLDGFQPSREELWKVRYAYYTLRPQPGMRLVRQDPSGEESQLDVMAKVTQGKVRIDLTSDGDFWNMIREGQKEARLHRHRFQLAKGDLKIWKMPQFDLSVREVDNIMKDAREFKAMILDLRGNGGGSVETLERLVGYFFDRDLVIAELKGRKKMDPMEAKTRGDNVFEGELVVLVDSDSGSASEIFARLVQLEQRGTVIGDRTSGAVMQSRHYEHQMGADSVIFYGASITDADVIMSDGKSLEKVGVAPDELLLPTAEDMATGRDPVLARAIELAGMDMSAEQAGSLFPVEWQD